MYTVYILKCADGKPYTGCTENLEERLKRHNNDYVPATENRLPMRLEFYFAIKDKYKWNGFWGEKEMPLSTYLPSTEFMGTSQSFS